MASKKRVSPPAQKVQTSARLVEREVEKRPLITLGSRQQLVAPAIVLLAICFGLYFQSMSFGYVLDDLLVIEENKFVQKGFGGLKEIFSEDSFTGYFGVQTKLVEGGRYRPLSLATFAAEIALFGKEKPFFGHLFNILFYWGSALLLFMALERILPKAENQKWYMSIPLWTAVLFVFHPLHSEAVANIKGRDEIMALIFSLGAMWAMLRYADGYGGWQQALSGVLLFLGLLAKENTITFVAIIPLTLWYFKGFTARQALAAIWPILVATLVFLMIRTKVLGYFMNPGVKITDLMNNPFVGMKSGEKFATIFLTLGWYIK